MSWTADPLERRRAERDRLLARAREHVEGLARRMPVAGAAVVGSVARGDFNVWSDVDLLLVFRSPAAKSPARLAALVAIAPPGIQIVAWSTDEFVQACRAGNPIAREALAVGEVLHGEGVLRSLAETDR